MLLVIAMSIISANSLFHFTPTLDNLLSILVSGFRPTYCKEFGASTNNYMVECEIPMVCFCDLPVSSLDKHIGLHDGTSGYGKYGLGMKKDWGIKKKLNPLTYFNNESALLEAQANANSCLKNIHEHYDSEYKRMIIKYGDNLPFGKWSIEEKIMIATLSSAQDALESNMFYMNFLKPYEDLVTKKRYYDEREWRYVVPYNNVYGYEVPVLWPTERIEQFANKEKYKQCITDKFMLTFDTSDIKYIIVESEKDVESVVKKLEFDTNKYSAIDQHKLIMKIITCDQIREDF